MKSSVLRAAPYALIFLLAASGTAAAQPADLILLNGRVYTADAAHPHAAAVAMRGDRIVFVGSAAEAGVLRGPRTRVIDVSGKTVLPGFTDSALPLTEKRLTDAVPTYPWLEELAVGFWASKAREYLGTDNGDIQALLGKESPEALAERLVTGTKLADPAYRKQLHGTQNDGW